MQKKNNRATDDSPTDYCYNSCLTVFVNCVFFHLFVCCPCALTQGYRLQGQDPQLLAGALPDRFELAQFLAVLMMMQCSNSGFAPDGCSEGQLSSRSFLIP
jgi:hypothetical protein